MPESIDAIARSVVDEGVAPAAAVSVAVRVGVGWVFRSAGAGRLAGSGRRLTSPETPFDWASVSKSFVAATVARLVRAGALGWDLELGKAVSETRSTPVESAPIERLLAHRAGLKPHLPLYRPLLEGRSFHAGAAIRAAATAMRVGTEPSAKGYSPLYSDLGYLLLGEAVARAAGHPIDHLVAREVAEPLGLEVGSSRQWVRWHRDFWNRVAPTEYVPWRGGQLAGVVHDENAWAFAGHAAAGHAGLFGGAESVARFGAAVLDAGAGRRDDWLDRDTLRPLLAERPGGTLRAGFDGITRGGSAAGQLCGPRTFGHLGFTGTSFWCDPDTECVTVMLTNRVNVGRHHLAIRSARPRIHDRLFRLALEIRGEGW